MLPAFVRVIYDYVMLMICHATYIYSVNLNKFIVLTNNYSYQGPEQENTYSKWTRPPPPLLNPQKDALIFQQIDIDHYNGKHTVNKLNFIILFQIRLYYKIKLYFYFFFLKVHHYLECLAVSYLLYQ